MQTFRVFSLITLVAGLIAAMPVQVRAEHSAPSPAHDREQPGLTDPAELETFIDDFMAAQMEPNHVAGVTISVVKDGQLFFAKGYGYADVQNRVPVDPDTTLFNTGSVGKPFTWTAVMQLVEQGKLDLSADVNTYLDFNIPATYPEPITLIHLLTHTPGFEDRVYGISASSPEKIVPLGQGWPATSVALFAIATPDAKVLTGEASLLNVLGFISIPLAVLAIGAVVFTVLAWKEQYWGIAGRVYYTLVTLAAVAFVWFLQYWNLLGMI